MDKPDVRSTSILAQELSNFFRHPYQDMYTLAEVLVGAIKDISLLLHLRWTIRVVKVVGRLTKKGAVKAMEDIMHHYIVTPDDMEDDGFIALTAMINSYEDGLFSVKTTNLTEDGRLVESILEVDERIVEADLFGKLFAKSVADQLESLLITLL